MPHITLKNRELFYEDLGTGFPLIFGHSYLWNAAMWQPQVEALSTKYRCIVPELWAHGYSDPLPETTYSVEALAKDYWDFAQALNLDRFALIGLSVGGMWATHLTLAHPQAVAALVLMDTHVGSEPPKSQALFLKMLDAVEMARAIPEGLQDLILPFFFSPHTLENASEIPAQFKHTLDAITRENIPSIVAMGRAIFTRNSVMERLEEIKIPALVVVGEHDHSRPPHEARAMAEALPDAQLAIISQAGHISTLEQPQQVNQHLSEFLKGALPG